VNYGLQDKTFGSEVQIMTSDSGKKEYTECWKYIQALKKKFYIPEESRVSVY
jgi:hypothetical protein